MSTPQTTGWKEMLAFLETNLHSEQYQVVDLVLTMLRDFLPEDQLQATLFGGALREYWVGQTDSPVEIRDLDLALAGTWVGGRDTPQLLFPLKYPPGSHEGVDLKAQITQELTSQGYQDLDTSVEEDSTSSTYQWIQGTDYGEDGVWAPWKKLQESLQYSSLTPEEQEALWNDYRMHRSFLWRLQVVTPSGQSFRFDLLLCGDVSHVLSRMQDFDLNRLILPLKEGSVMGLPPRPQSSLVKWSTDRQTAWYRLVPHTQEEELLTQIPELIRTRKLTMQWISELWVDGESTPLPDRLILPPPVRIVKMIERGYDFPFDDPYAVTRLLSTLFPPSIMSRSGNLSKEKKWDLLQRSSATMIRERKKYEEEKAKYFERSRAFTEEYQVLRQVTRWAEQAQKEWNRQFEEREKGYRQAQQILNPSASEEQLEEMVTRWRVLYRRGYPEPVIPTLDDRLVAPTHPHWTYRPPLAGIVETLFTKYPDELEEFLAHFPELESTDRTAWDRPLVEWLQALNVARIRKHRLLTRVYATFSWTQWEEWAEGQQNPELVALLEEHRRWREEKRLEKAKKEAQRLEERAQQEAQRLAEEAEREKMRMEEEAKKEAQRLAEEAERKKRRLEEEAKKEAQRLAEEAEQEKRRLEEEAKKEAQRLAEEAEMKRTRLEEEARQEAQRVEKAIQEAKRLGKKGLQEAQWRKEEYEHMMMDPKKRAIKLAKDMKRHLMIVEVWGPGLGGGERD